MFIEGGIGIECTYKFQKIDFSIKLLALNVYIFAFESEAKK